MDSINGGSYHNIANRSPFHGHFEDRVQERTDELQVALRELSEANKALEALSTIDGLTGVKNRRYFDNAYKIEWKRSHRDRLPLSILMIDIDHFKAVNDKYGHLAGDDCLRAIAQTIKTKVRRPPDAVARYGGEEFTVILPSTPMAGAIHVAESIRKAIEKMAVSFEEGTINLTVSIGVATLTPEDINNPEVIISSADNAMYQAKKNGRNQISVCPLEIQKFAS